VYGTDGRHVELTCSDFPAALAALERLGLRVDMIVPADDPQIATLSGNGVSIRLVRGTPVLAPDELVPSFVITRAGAWHRGRAGMQYRDLIPDRQGGRFVASHIRVPDGGLVPDYVHYHRVRFQMIYCHAGWVRLVYEDQGEPFVMHEGECVSQPPQIRHRVLECSPGLEVIEVGSPAVHPTFADHETSLPNGARDRCYSGQRFVHLKRGFSDDAMTEATGGVASLRIRTDARSIDRDGQLLFGFVRHGTLRIDDELLGKADSFVVDRTHVLHDPSPDLEWLELFVPHR